MHLSLFLTFCNSFQFIISGYCIGLGRIADYNLLYTSFNPLWSLGISLSALLAVGVTVKIFNWRPNDWSEHPIVKTLTAYSNGRSWRTVAADIEIEFRRIDKFASSVEILPRVIVTDSWVMVVSMYALTIVHQSDIRLSMLSSEEHQLSHVGGTGMVQILNIRVDTTRRDLPSFNIR